MRVSAIGKAFAAVALSATIAQAQASQLNIVGTVDLYQTLPGATQNLVIDFLPTGGGNGTVATPVPFTGNTGIFAAIAPGTLGTNIDFVFGPAGSPAPTTPPVPILTIGGYTFTATTFAPGNTGTPVTVTEQGGTTYALLTVSGFVNGPGLTANTAFTGGYSTQFPGTTAAQLISTIEQGLPFTVRASSVSASFVVSAVPEPATVALMATGLVALFGGTVIRRRNQA